MLGYRHRRDRGSCPGWLDCRVAINSGIHDKVQQRVERAISDGMQAAVAEAPLRYMGTEQGNFYVPDIWRLGIRVPPSALNSPCRDSTRGGRLRQAPGAEGSGCNCDGQ